MNRSFTRQSTLSGEHLDGRFEIGDKVGSGGMSTVYRALDRTSGEFVALKVLHSNPERFEREAQLLAEVEHPHIVRYVAHGSTPNGSRYLAMEWLDGQDLEEVLQARETLGIDETLLLLQIVSEALGAAHAQGVTHRDIKPSNIILVGGEIESAKLIDFGVAKFTDGTQRVTRTGIQIGTPGYMSPEQVRGKRDIDARADVFALGCVAFECLTGHLPFEADHAVAVLSKILFEEAAPVASLRHDVPAQLDILIRSMLEKDPAARPADGNAVRAELDALDLLATAGATQPINLRDVLALMEQQAVTVLVTGTALPTDLEDTIAEDPGRTASPLPWDALEEKSRGFGAQLELLAEGTVVAIFSGDGESKRQASSAADCALAFHGALGAIPIAIATGLRNDAFHLPIGEVIDRAVEALATTPDGRVSLDGQTAELLGDRFAINRLGSSTYLAGRRTPDE
ncbi:MAG: serine/threonine protein kinase [Myxococcales bacterium]|nr:serine/threonine protein kinase [Myxococcales bacterium]